MNARSKNSTAYLCLILVFFCWGSVYVANRYILQALAPTELAFLRFLLSALALGSVVKIRHIPVRIEKKDWKYMLFIGFMGYYLSMECTLLSVQYTSASMASLINSLNPVFITLFAAFFLKEALTKKKILCLVLGLAGVFIVTSGNAAGTTTLGVLYGIGSILTWAWTAMYSRRLSKKYPALLITFLGISCSLLFHLPTAAVSLVREGLPSISPFLVLCILYSALCGTAFPQFLWNFALSRLEAGTCSLFYPLMPVFSSVLGILLLGETLTLHFVIGGLVIGSTIVISCLGGRLPSRRIASHIPQPEQT